VFDAASGRRLWQATRTGPISELLGVEPELARLIARREFGVLSARDSVALGTRPTNDGVAYAHYLRGVAYLADPAKLRDATSELEISSEGAPKLATAFSALAIAYTHRAAMMPGDSVARDSLLRRAATASSRAISLEPKAAHAWIARGEVLAGGHPHRLASARAAYEHALTLEPMNAEAHGRLGRVLLLQGAAAAAESQLLRAVILDPENPAPLVDLGELELNQRAFGQSCRALDLALSIDPRLSTAYELRAMARLHRGDVRPAWIDAETGKRLGAEVAGRAVSVLVDVAAHDTASARAAIKVLQRTFDSRRAITAHDAGYLALGLTALGDRSGAMDVLDRVRPRDEELSLVLHRPGFDALSSESRFRKLLESSSAAGAPR
jgi:Tfp pilus assembly protein PilF